MRLTLVTAPTEEPVTLQEAQEFLRVDTDDEASTILRQLRVCREMAEAYTRRQFITSTWDLSLDGFPQSSGLRRSGPDGEFASGSIILPRPPCQSVTSVTYVDLDGNPQVWDSGNYILEQASGEPARIFPAYGVSWPDYRPQRQAVTVRFVAGYGDSPEDVPECAREAMLMMLAARFSRRSAFTEPVAGPPVYTPGGWKALLGRIRLPEVA